MGFTCRENLPTVDGSDLNPMPGRTEKTEETTPAPSSGAGDIGGSLIRRYDTGFEVTDEYREGLPDQQNASSANIEGADIPILQVGISDFRLPLSILTGDGDARPLEVAVTGSVSLPSEAKGVNMSRIIREFYTFKERVFRLELLEEILLRLKAALGSSRAHLELRFSYPVVQNSLRSGLAGYQYYDVVYEGLIDDLNRFRKRIHFDFIYSSACPSSADLAEHARNRRDTYAVPHSQRSKARISVEVSAGSCLSVEDLLHHCRTALHTETQVMVKREDEQAFAELNGAHLKFVEDAVRLVHERLDGDKRIADFQVSCAHFESLHSYNAVAVVTKGVRGGFSGDLSV